MDPSKERERIAVGRFADLLRARGVPRSTVSTPAGLPESSITDRFAGRTRTKLGEMLLMVEAMEGDRDEDLAAVGGAFHPEVYLAALEKRGDRQKRYAKSDVPMTPPGRPYSPEQLRKVAAGLQELRLLDRDKAQRQAVRVLRTLQFYPDRGDLQSEFDTRRALAAIWRARGWYSGSAAFLGQCFRLAGKDRRLRALSCHALAPLARDVGDLEAALEAVKRAGTNYLLDLDLRGVGRSLITRGSLLTYRGQLDDASTAFLAGISWIGDDEWYWQYAGFQNLAFCHLYRDELEEAYCNASSALDALDVDAVDAPLQKSAAGRSVFC